MAVTRTDQAVTTRELLANLAGAGMTIVDTRPLYAYNGWRDGTTGGGHIPGAVAFPSSWLATLDDADLEEVLAAKGITRDTALVLYGARPDDVSSVQARLSQLGHHRIRAYERDWDAWASDPGLPVERLAHYERLVHPQWLRELLDGGSPEAAPAGDHLLFHVNFGVPEEYADSHLPGALYLDTNWLENPVDWNRRTSAELDAAVRALGITRDTTVILYGRDTEGRANERWPGKRAGQIAAARAALILTYCGVEDIRLLDGGYDNWVKTGLPLETTAWTPTPVATFGAEIPAPPDVIVDIDEAKEILGDPAGGVLVSVRTWREHIGEVSGYNYIEPAGRIAGDVWGNCGTDAYHMQHYRNVDNTMRAYPEIAANWEAAGITPDKWVAYYCGTGWRASETWFYARLMGWPRVAVYDGGWFEWSKDPLENPIEVGLEEEIAA
jgi:thiosulfate/3-mercaptopyruvate sulfurtransferase